MAEIDSRSRARDAVKREVAMQMFPDLRLTDWIGSARALVDDGLIPGAFVWPQGKDKKSWVIGGLKFTVKRCRPPEMKGPASKWTDVDYWSLRTEPSSGSWSGHDATLEKIERECARIRFANSVAGYEQKRRFTSSKQDSAFQSFKRKLLTS
ncbi:MAG: hypothetical protein Q8R33_15575 [Burkholderiales bacterium]|nr:hypothetical protein [Burkholderiales bacterium]